MNVGEVSVKITGDLSGLLKAQQDAKKIMTELDAVLGKTAKDIENAFSKISPDFSKVFNGLQKEREAIAKASEEIAKREAAAVIEAKRMEAEAASKAAKQTEDTARSTRRAQQETEKYNKSLDDLRKKYDAVYAIESQFNQQKQELNTLLSSNMISQETFNQSMARATTQYEAQIAMLGRHSNGVKLNNQQLVNMQYQLNDIAVMLASGQNPFIMLMQQGMQIGQMFAPGTGVLAAIRSVGTGIVTFMTNPINLAVLATASLAGAIPMLWEAFNGGNEAENAQKRLEEINDLIKEIEKTAPSAAKAIKEIMDAAKSTGEIRLGITKQIEQLNEELKTAQDALITIRTGGQGGLNRSLGFEGRKIIDDLNKMVMRIKETGQGTEELRNRLIALSLDPNLDENIRRVVESLDASSEKVLEVEQRLAAFRQGLDLIPDQKFSDVARGVSDLVNELSSGSAALDQNTAKFEELRNAAIFYADDGLARLKEEISNIRVPETREYLDDLVSDFEKGKISAEDLESAINALDGLSFDNSAILSSIQSIAAQAIGAVQALNQLRSAANSTPEMIASQYSQYGAGRIAGEKEIVRRKQAGEDFIKQQQMLNSLSKDELALYNEKESIRRELKDLGAIVSPEQIDAIARANLAANKARGGGSKERKKDASYLQQLSEETMFLQQQLDIMSLGYFERDRKLAQLEEERQIAEALRRLSDEATPAERAAVIEQIKLQQQLNAEIAKQKQIQETLQGGYTAAAGELGSALAGVVNGTQSLEQGLIRVVAQLAQAVIQAQILKSFMGSDGKLTSTGSIISSFFRGLLSFDGGGSTGSGPRSGGLDGKGGFLAMVHPNETIIDHEKTGGITIPRSQMSPNVGSGGPTSVTVSLDLRTDSTVVAEIADTQIQSRAPAIVKTSVQQSQKATQQNMPAYLANAQARQL